MKNRFLTTSLLLLAAMGVLFASCKKEYPQPPIQNLPIGTVYTIDQIIAMTPGTVFDTASVYGIVTADEQSGNLYKSAYIQDRATGAAIQLYLNAVSGVRIGDSVRIYLKDVKFDMYHGLPQLSEFGPDGHIIILANDRPIEPAVTTLANVNSGQHLAQLIKLEGVSFVDQEGAFAPSTGYGERYIQDAFGNTAMVRTSNYANFANNPLPKGTGNLIAIASLYNTTWQLTLRSYYELEFDGIDPGGGGNNPGDEQSLPYTQLFSAAFGSYMTYSVLGDDQFWKIDYSSAVMTGHEKIGDEHFYYENEDWLISSPVKLTDVDHVKAIVSYAAQYNGPSSNDVTMQVSSDYEYGTDPTQATWTELPVVYPNSSGWNFQEVETSLDAFLGQTVNVAIKFVSSTSASRTFEVQSISIVQGEAGDVPTPPTPGEGEGSGTADDPYNVAAGIGLQGQGVTGWVQGYIVGAVMSGPSSVSSNDDINWAAPFTRATNVLIADDPTCNEVSNCIIIELGSTTMKSQVNLVDNPGNLGKRLAVLGTFRKYFNQSGLRDCPGTENDFVLEGGDTPTPPEPPTPGEVIFSETFANSQGQFTIQDVELSGLSYVWKHDASYHYMKASAYVSTPYEAESWLVSPVIDLSDVSTATFKFEQIINHANSPQSILHVMISSDYSGDVQNATWSELMLDQWPAGNSWTSVNSLADLTAFAGQRVTIAFKYTSLAVSGQCPTWEVMNLVVE